MSKPAELLYVKSTNETLIKDKRHQLSYETDKRTTRDAAGFAWHLKRQKQDQNPLLYIIVMTVVKFYGEIHLIFTML